MTRSPHPHDEAGLHQALAAVQVQLDARFGAVMALNRLAFAGRDPAGKLLRPRLLLAVASACAGGTIPRRTVEIAAAIELIHLATLHHDDVLDSSPARRRKAAVHTLLGNKVSILVGDSLMTSALELLSAHATRAMLIAVSRAMTVTLRGEVEQHVRHRSLDIPERECVRVSARKTGRLFALAAQLGAMLARSEPASVALAARFGGRAGTAFQLIDDAADYIGTPETLGKPPGTDYREGIATLPLVHAWYAGSEEDRRTLAAGFGSDEDAEAFPAACAAVIRAGGIAHTHDSARRSLRAAHSILRRFAAPEHRRLASEYVDDITQRIPQLPGRPRLSA